MAELTHDVVMVGLPMLTILAGSFFQNARLDRVESRIEDRLNRMEDKIDQRFNAVDRKFEGVDSKFEGVNRRFDSIHSDLHRFYEMYGELKGKIETIEKRR